MRRMLDAVYRVHQLSLQVNEVDTTLDALMREGKIVAEAEACSMLLYDDKSNELFFHVTMGDLGDQRALKEQVRLALGQGIAGKAALDRCCIRVDDVTNDPDFFNVDDISQMKTQSLLALPMVDQEHLIGVVELVNKVGEAKFSEADQRILEVFASLAASVIVRARLIEEKLRTEKLAAIGQAVAGLSHYTKNILHGLSGSVELLDQHINAEKDPVVQSSWPILKRNVGRIGHVVEDMLAYSKPRVPMLEWCQVDELLQDVLESVRNASRNIETSIELNVDDGPDKIYVDEQGIFRCLLNLLSNALDATKDIPNGAVQITSTTTDSNKWHLEVNDTGPGVNPSEMNTIFDPFFSTKGSNGTGLGLAVSQKIVEEHEGRLWVEPGVPSGASFCLEIPQLKKE
jgi:signal transduction histidine kinase